MDQKLICEKRALELINKLSDAGISLSEEFINYLVTPYKIEARATILPGGPEKLKKFYSDVEQTVDLCINGFANQKYSPEKFDKVFQLILNEIQFTDILAEKKEPDFDLLIKSILNLNGTYTDEDFKKVTSLCRKTPPSTIVEFLAKYKPTVKQAELYFNVIKNQEATFENFPIEKFSSLTNGDISNISDIIKPLNEPRIRSEHALEKYGILKFVDAFSKFHLNEKETRDFAFKLGKEKGKNAGTPDDLERLAKIITNKELSDKEKEQFAEIRTSYKTIEDLDKAMQDAIDYANQSWSDWAYEAFWGALGYDTKSPLVGTQQTPNDES
jgi:hypothetical protein